MTVTLSICPFDFVEIALSLRHFPIQNRCGDSWIGG